MTRYLCVTLTVLLLTFTAAMAGAQADAGANQAKGNDPPTSSEAYVAAFNAKALQAFNMMKQAEALLQKKETAKAIVLLQQSLVVFPGFYTVRLMLTDLYNQQKKPEAVLQVLQPVIFTQYFIDTGKGAEVTTVMKYVLALLDTRQWEEAVALYTKCVSEPLPWGIAGYSSANGGKEHTLPDVHFSPEIFNEPGLRAQAHLILGSRPPQFGLASLEQKDELPYMLDQLQQVLKSDRNSLDAQFLIAFLLGDMRRYEEARKAFAILTKNAPREVRPEIKATQAYFDKLEENFKNFKAQQAKRQAEQKAQAPGNAAP